MDAATRARLSAIAHDGHPVAAPVADSTIDALLERLAGFAPRQILDVGCGPGEWIVRLLRRTPAATGVGVDTSPEALGAARETARAAGVGERLRTVCLPAAELPAEEHDALLCVGASHALGGLAEALSRLHRWAATDAVLLFGDGFWRQPPTDAALEALDCSAADFPTYAELVATVDAAGWRPVHAHVSTVQEWDDYEWSWVSALAGWAASNPDDPDAAAAAAWGREHRDQWLSGYRGILGFAVVTAVRSSGRAGGGI